MSSLAFQGIIAPNIRPSYDELSVAINLVSVRRGGVLNGACDLLCQRSVSASDEGWYRCRLASAFSLPSNQISGSIRMTNAKGDPFGRPRSIEKFDYRKCITVAGNE